jgi:hypothetical protein
MKVANSAFASQAREVGRTQRQLLVVFAESLSKSLAVWIKGILATLLPRSF